MWDVEECGKIKLDFVTSYEKNDEEKLQKAFKAFMNF